MGSRRRSTLRVLGCALLITLQLAYIKMAAADTILGAEIANIERLLDAERYADADSKALLVIEQAYQQNQVPADDFLKLGVLFLNASRFEVSKVVFSAALERYTSTGALSKMALTLLHLAISERHLSNYDSALTYVHRAMSIAQIERNDTLKA